MISDKEALEFMDIVYHILNDEHYYLLPVKDNRKAHYGKILAGYYDREYIYIIPSVVIAAADTIRLRDNLPKINVHRVLQQLFAADMIKVHWILTGEVRYRPQKRVGNTRYRYITFYKKPLLEEMFLKVVKK